MTTGSSSKPGPAHRLVEAGVTLLITLFGVIVIIGSVKWTNRRTAPAPPPPTPTATR